MINFINVLNKINKIIIVLILFSIFIFKDAVIIVSLFSMVLLYLTIVECLMKKRITVNSAVFMMIFFFMFNVISIIVNKNLILGMFLSIPIMIIIFFSAINVSNFSEKEIQNVARILSSLLVIQIIYKFIELKFIRNIESIFYKIEFVIPIGSSNTIGFYIIVLFSLLFFKSNKTKIDNILIFLLTISAFLINSRTTIFILIFAMFFLGSFSIKKKLRVIISLIVIFLTINIISPDIIHRIIGNNNKSQNLNTITNGRIDVYREGIATFKDNIVFGVGIGNIKDNKNIFTDSEYFRSHNFIIDAYAYSGIFAGTLYIVLIVNVLLNIRKGRREYNKIAFITIILILIQALFEPTLFGYKCDIIFWLIGGVALNKKIR